MRTRRHRTCQRLLLAICCSSATACLSQAETDGGNPDPATDGGFEIDGGPRDAGGEGEGEGESCFYAGELPGHPDDAGVIHYEDCELTAEFLFGSCNDGSCATNETQAQMIDLIFEVARARGYEEQVEVVSVDDELFYPTVRVVYVVDWARAWQHVQLGFDDAGILSPLEAEVQMPTYLPRTLPAIAEVLTLLNGCADDVHPDFCWARLERGWPCSGYYRLEGMGGVGAANCVGASVLLWDPCDPDAGPSDLTCFTADVPCCDD